MTTIDKNYNIFKKYLKAYVEQDSVDSFITWLDSTDFKTAPASSKYHLCCEGGLVKHSLNVFFRLFQLLRSEYPDEIVVDENNKPLVDEDGKTLVKYTCPFDKSSIAFVSLLHDISKANYYKISYKNVQNQETGAWEKKPYYNVRDESERTFFGSHEENSLFILSKFFDITDDEAVAIRYHMGMLEETNITSGRMFHAYKTNPLAFFLHEADMMAMCLDEKENFENVEINEQNNTKSNK